MQNTHTWDQITKCTFLSVMPKDEAGRPMSAIWLQVTLWIGPKCALKTPAHETATLKCLSPSSSCLQATTVCLLCFPPPQKQRACGDGDVSKIPPIITVSHYSTVAQMLREGIEHRLPISTSNDSPLRIFHTAAIEMIQCCMTQKTTTTTKCL